MLALFLNVRFQVTAQNIFYFFVYTAAISVFTRVLLLGAEVYPRSWNAGRCFDGLHAHLAVEEKLPIAGVRHWLERISLAPR